MISSKIAETVYTMYFDLARRLLGMDLDAQEAIMNVRRLSVAVSAQPKSPSKRGRSGDCLTQ
jgi:hypothetical protein